MAEYVKFIDEHSIEYPPINKDGIINYNLDIERLIADGYKILVKVERPETDRYFEIIYENKDTINEKVHWLETKKEYDARKLQEAKDAKRQENLVKRTSIRAIRAWFSASVSGYLLRNTPVGDIMTVVMGIALPSMMAQQPIEAGVMRYYDAEGNSYPTPKIEADFVPTFYQRFATSIAGIDAHSTEIEKEIDEAKTIEEVNAIVIDYEVVGAI